MLRVRVELVPGGDEKQAKVLGQLEVANLGEASLYTGAYDVVMDEYDERVPGRRSTFRTTAVLDNVERDILRPMQLIGMALSVVVPVRRMMSSSLEAPIGIVLQREEI
ncbi:hypothetical protein [Cupriavidus necator]|uniref:hypothetical protein n=1 Tax=Cupriavidus necator TaxID=106590 RepID=UPI003F73A4B4